MLQHKAPCCNVSDAWNDAKGRANLAAFSYNLKYILGKIRFCDLGTYGVSPLLRGSSSDGLGAA